MDLPPTARAYTEVSTPVGTVVWGVLDFDKTWTAAKSPYIIEGYVTVAKKATLTVEAGVTVRVNSSTVRGDLYVDGNLTVEGTENAPVIVTSNKTSPAPDDYRNVWINASARLMMNWTEVWHAHSPLVIVSGGNIVRNSKFFWDHHPPSIGGPGNLFDRMEVANITISPAFNVRGANNLITNSTIRDNIMGLLLDTGASGSVVTNNTFRDNEDWGLAIRNGLTGVKVHHNNFVNNGRQALVLDDNTDFDNGYPSGGNYWSDYTGVDECSGPNQDICPDPDGIGDTPYEVPHPVTGDPTDWDFYPLVCPTWGCPALDLTLSSADITFFPESPQLNNTVVTINATIHNVGGWVASNVTIEFFDGHPSLSKKIGANQFIPRIEGNGSMGYAEVQWMASPPGSHEIFVLVDSENSIKESNESNNNASAPFLVLGLPDLMVSQPDISLAPSGTVSQGESVLINATIRNIGDANTTNVSVGFFDGDPALGEQIDGDQSVLLIERYGGYDHAQVSWIASPVGIHNICVFADPDDAVEEWNESNNLACVDIQVLSLPDMQVLENEIIFTPPSPVDDGTSVSISAAIYNNGDIDAVGFNNTIFEDENGNRLIDPGEIIEVSFTPILPGHDSTSLSTSFVANEAGYHDICVWTDSPPGVVNETNETNNLACRSLHVLGKPDYAPWSVIPSSPVKVGTGKSCAISSYAKNLGEESATATSVLAFYNESERGTPFQTHQVLPLDVEGVSPQFFASWKAPSTAGTYLVYVEVDYNDDLAELNESNNLFVIQYNVTSAPVTHIHYTSPNYSFAPVFVNSSTVFSFTVEDNSGTGTGSTYYRVDDGPWINYTSTGSFSIPLEGVHTIQYNSTDNLGTEEETNSLGVVVDNTPPATTVVLGEPIYVSTDTWVASKTEFSLSATDGGEIPVGMEATEYRIWEDTSWSTWNPYTGHFSLGEEEGVHYLQFRSHDHLGNIELPRNETYVIDNTPPITSISIGEPTYIDTNVWVTSSTQLFLTSSDGGIIPAGLLEIRYRIWDNGWSLWGGFTEPFTLPGEDGAKWIEYYAIDNLGWEEEIHNETYLLDDTPPTATLNVGLPSYMASDTWVKSNTTLSLSSSDWGPLSSGVSSTEYRIWKDGSWSQWMIHEQEFNLSDGDGIRYLEYRSLDNLGNVEGTRNETVMVDDSPPTSSISPSGEIIDVGTNVTLVATDEGGCGVKYTEYRINHGDWKTYSEPFSLNEDGRFTIDFHSIDRLGNLEDEKTMVVEITKPQEEVNWKPLIALTFSVIIGLFGAYVSRRRQPRLKGRKLSPLKTWLAMCLPVLLIEAGTGILSLFTGYLSIPPILGAGTVVDSLILGASFVFLTAYLKKRTLNK